MTIIHDEGLGGEPRIEETRIGVRHIVALAIDGCRSPAYVGDQLDITLAQVHERLPTTTPIPRKYALASGRIGLRSMRSGMMRRV